MNRGKLGSARKWSLIATRRVVSCGALMRWNGATSASRRSLSSFDFGVGFSLSRRVAFFSGIFGAARRSNNLTSCRPIAITYSTACLMYICIYMYVYVIYKWSFLVASQMSWGRRGEDGWSSHRHFYYGFSLSFSLSLPLFVCRNFSHSLSIWCCLTTKVFWILWLVFVNSFVNAEGRDGSSFTLCAAKMR